MKIKINKNINSVKSTLFFSIFGMLFFLSTVSFADELTNHQTSAEAVEGKEIFISNVKYSLTYLGLKLCDPIANQEDYTLVYSLGYSELSDKILLPIQQILSHNKLQAGKLTTFQENQGFCYRVLYKHRHVGNLIIINERVVNENHKKDELVSKQEIIIEEPNIKQNVVEVQTKKVLPVITDDRPKLAIIIDDFGYSNSSETEEFLKLDLDITVSIIPGHQFSSLIAENAKSQNKEVIIHMPMASDKENLNNGEKEFLLSDILTASEIKNRVDRAIINIPNAVGMNNHMGSVATSNPDVVLPLLKVLKLKNLYFVDSLTSPLSIVYENCIIQDIQTGKRRYFIDNEKDKNEIINQLHKAIKYAKRHGKIIVTGHTYRETLDAIKYMVETNQFSDINVCPASEIVQ